jgi:ATP-dependent DNA helicase RecQ
VTVNKELVQKIAVPETVNAGLFKTLKTIRLGLAKEENVAAFQVFSDATLVELATYLPLTNSALAKISGFGTIKLEKYGNYFLDAIIDYCRENNLTTKIDAKQPKRQRKTATAEKTNDTKKQSLQLFQMGRSVDEIAFERGLSTGTVEGHLAHFIFSGELKINEMVSAEKLKIISKAIEENNNSLAIAPIKQKLGDGFSYGEITAVMNYLRRMSEA